MLPPFAEGSQSCLSLFVLCVVCCVCVCCPQVRDIKEVVPGMAAPGVAKRGKKAKDSLYFSLVRAPVPLHTRAHTLSCSHTRAHTHILSHSHTGLIPSMPAQITPTRELNFEAASKEERDWLVAGFKAVIDRR